MRTIEHELRDLYPLDWQPSSLRPHGFELFTAGLARRGLVTVQGARAGTVLVVKAEVVSASLRHYFVCVADAHGAGMVASGPNLAEELRNAAKNDEGIRAALATSPKPDADRMRATLERCVKVLQGVQWSATEHDKYGHPEHGKCPVCEAADFGQGAHLAECELAACIRDGNGLMEGL